MADKDIQPKTFQEPLDEKMGYTSPQKYENTTDKGSGSGTDQGQQTQESQSDMK